MINKGNKFIKLGLIVFANESGLGYQTRELTNLLHPHRLLIVDSTSFSKNKKQHLEWYEGYEHIITNGFPQNYDIHPFLEGLTHVLCCENPYNFYLLKVAREMGIKVFIQTNYEFCENLNSPHLPLPDKFLMPSFWKVNEMKKKYGGERVCYLPPSLDIHAFEQNFLHNTKRRGKKKFLHVGGTIAAQDRNGTLALLEALPYVKEDFELTISFQHVPPDYYITDDERVKYVFGSVDENTLLYKGYDALLFPRRYGGLSLTINEGLASGLPVLVTDISPNNEWLPVSWRLPAKKIGELKTRAVIDVYSTDPVVFAQKIDEFCTKDLLTEKMLARELARTYLSRSALLPEYKRLLEE